MAMHGFQELVNSKYAKVFYHCLKQVRNDHDAADITQSTFFKAFLRYGSLRSPESAEPWLFRICNNEIKQFYRNNAKREPVSAPPETSEHGELYAAIDQLSEAQRQVILLTYFGGYTMQELAIALSCRVSTVKSRLYEARQAIKRIMDVSSRSVQSKRRKKIMSAINLCEIGAQTIPCLSLNAQRQLLQTAKDNAKFTAAVLSELSLIPTGPEFLNAANGTLSYAEFLKILACCDEATLYRIIGKPYFDWRSASDDLLIKDIAELRGHGGYIDSVETILYVPSLLG
jgi:RNA polymerase sigma-70 factor (ECF subfamily)